MTLLAIDMIQLVQRTLGLRPCGARGVEVGTNLAVTCRQAHGHASFHQATIHDRTVVWVDDAPGDRPVFPTPRDRMVNRIVAWLRKISAAAVGEG